LELNPSRRRPAVADHIRDDGHQTRRHLAEVDVGIADGRRDQLGNLADINDAHGSFVPFAEVWLSKIPSDLAQVHEWTTLAPG
jgi:hypothetical protein